MNPIVKRGLELTESMTRQQQKAMFAKYSPYQQQRHTQFKQLADNAMKSRKVQVKNATGAYDTGETDVHIYHASGRFNAVIKKSSGFGNIGPVGGVIAGTMEDPSSSGLAHKIIAGLSQQASRKGHD